MMTIRGRSTGCSSASSLEVVIWRDSRRWLLNGALCGPQFKGYISSERIDNRQWTIWVLGLFEPLLAGDAELKRPDTVGGLLEPFGLHKPLAVRHACQET
jgi:hypothetical protein